MVVSESLFYVVAAAALVLGNGLAVSGASENSKVKVWPMPASVSYGNAHLYLAGDFGLSSNHDSQILKDAFDRMLAVIKLDHVIDANFSAFDRSSLLQGLHIVVSSPNEELQYGTDESYKLMVPSPEKPGYAHLEAKTVYGALHGLQTFSQLCYFSITRRVLEVHMSPWTIIDQPRFSYRGLLIDTSRHYLPMTVIKKVIDSMSYAKLIHNLSLSRYLHTLNCGMVLIHPQSDIQRPMQLKFYAQKRGISVLAEIDVPGHALSWGVGYPSLWPSKNCQQPLDVSNEFTFKVIDGILSDFSKIFNFKFVHLGGDEVNTTCWTTTPRISKWLKRHRMNESQAYEYFVLRAQNIALSHGYEIVNWLGVGVAQRVVESGLRCIVSNQDRWYLDHLDTPWQEFYINEPLTNITNSKQQKLVIGGEVCMWGETADGSDIEQTIWPRAAAAAERLWTPFDKLAKNPREATGRLATFRCLLNQRGIAAAPLAGSGRAAPLDPVATDHFKANLGGSDTILPDLRHTRNVSGSGVGYGQGRTSTLEPLFRERESWKLSQLLAGEEGRSTARHRSGLPPAVEKKLPYLKINLAPPPTRIHHPILTTNPRIT
ncbi:Beta-hexosaminidase 3 [Hibiscus syriacus]|uniref:beta-N-acetylhexosaminidase n=1 Tax=Hibiscus syriacus TaxID=106335 RepID=A0A6A2WQX3_HIBSY|nr:Beta-hexosaminidase 3 [Hibiscus syriacus]